MKNKRQRKYTKRKSREKKGKKLNNKSGIINKKIITVLFAFLIAIVVVLLYYTGIHIVNNRIVSQHVRFLQKEYNNVSTINQKLIMTEEKSNKWSILDINGKVIQGPVFERILPEKEGMIPYKKNGKFGFMDVNGRIIIEPKFDNVSSFCEGLAAVCVNNKWGVVNKRGDFVILPTFNDIIIHSKDVIQAKKGNKWGVIDSKGRIVLSFDYKEITVLDFHGVFVVRKGNGGYFLVSMKNNKVSFEFDNYQLNLSKYMPYFKNGKWGILTLDSFETIYQPIYDQIWVNNDGWIELRKDRYMNILTKDGVLIKKEFNIDDIVMKFDNYIVVKRQKDSIVFINIKNTKIFEMKAEDITPFKNGFAAIKSKGKWGLIDSNLKYVIKPNYDSIWIQDKKHVFIYNKGKWGIMDINQKLRFPTRLSLIGDVKENLISVLIDGKWGVLNSDGKFVVKPEFEQIILHSSKYIFGRKKDKWTLFVISNNKIYFTKFYAYSVSIINNKICSYTYKNGIRLFVLK